MLLKTDSFFDFIGSFVKLLLRFVGAGLFTYIGAFALLLQQLILGGMIFVSLIVWFVLKLLTLGRRGDNISEILMRLFNQQYYSIRWYIDNIYSFYPGVKAEFWWFPKIVE